MAMIESRLCQHIYVARGMIVI